MLERESLGCGGEAEDIAEGTRGFPVACGDRAPFLQAGPEVLDTMAIIAGPGRAGDRRFFGGIAGHAPRCQMRSQKASEARSRSPTTQNGMSGRQPGFVSDHATPRPAEQAVPGAAAECAVGRGLDLRRDLARLRLRGPCDRRLRSAYRSKASVSATNWRSRRHGPVPGRRRILSAPQRKTVRQAMPGSSVAPDKTRAPTIWAWNGSHRGTDNTLLQPTALRFE